MKGPYSIIVTDGASGWTGVESVKRDAIARMKRNAKAGTDQAKAEVRDRDGHLVKQMEAYRGPSGAIKLRDLPL